MEIKDFDEKMANKATTIYFPKYAFYNYFGFKCYFIMVWIPAGAVL